MINIPNNHPCPNCGYCPHCGRGSQPFYYPYQVPYMPSYPAWTPYYGGGTTPVGYVRYGGYCE